VSEVITGYLQQYRGGGGCCYEIWKEEELAGPMMNKGEEVKEGKSV